MYHRAIFWIVEEEITCSTLRIEDGSWQGMYHNCQLKGTRTRDMDDEGCVADLHTQYPGCETGNAVREYIAYNFLKFIHR